MADNSIGLALTGLGGTLRDLAAQEAQYRQQERTGQLALAEVGLKSQLLQQQGQQDIAKQGVSLEQARSQTALGQFDAGLRSAEEQRRQQKFPLEQESLQTGINYNKFQLKRGETLLPGEQNLQQAHITNLGSQTGLTRAQTTELTDPNSPSNIVKREHAGLLHQQNLSTAQDVATKTYQNTEVPLFQLATDYIAPLAFGNPVQAQLGMDAFNDWYTKAGIDPKTTMVKRSEAPKYAELIKAAYPYLEKYAYSETVDNFLKEYQRTGDKAWLGKAQEAATRAQISADPKIQEKLMEKSIASGRNFQDVLNEYRYQLRPVDGYVQDLLNLPENAKARAQMSKEQQTAFDKNLRNQAETYQARDAFRIDHGQGAMTQQELIAASRQSQGPPKPQVQGPPEPGAWNRLFGGGAAPQGAPEPGTPQPMRETPTLSSPDRRTFWTDLRDAGEELLRPGNPATPAETLYRPPQPGLAQAATATPIPRNEPATEPANTPEGKRVPEAISGMMVWYDQLRERTPHPVGRTATAAPGRGPLPSEPTFNPSGLPDGSYNVPLNNGHVYDVTVTKGRILALTRRK